MNADLRLVASVVMALSVAATWLTYARFGFLDPRTGWVRLWPLIFTLIAAGEIFFALHDGSDSAAVNGCFYALCGFGIAWQLRRAGRKAAVRHDARKAAAHDDHNPTEPAVRPIWYLTAMLAGLVILVGFGLLIAYGVRTAPPPKQRSAPSKTYQSSLDLIWLRNADFLYQRARDEGDAAGLQVALTQMRSACEFVGISGSSKDSSFCRRFMQTGRYPGPS